jgi:hypothetical protein
VGSPADPYNSIQDAIDAADVETEVRIAGGTYELNTGSQYTPAPMIVLKAGVSLVGGYSADFGIRDVELYETIIEDTNTPTSGGTYVAVSCSPQSSVQNVIEGLTITGNTALDSPSKSYAIRCSHGSNIVIRDNTLGGFRVGVGLPDGGEVTGNTITANRYGIETTGGAIYNNVIIASSYSEVLAYGIAADLSLATLIANNTILAMNGGSVRGIDVAGTAGMATIKNNIIVAYSSDFCYGIRPFVAPESVQNNDIYVTDDLGTIYVGSNGNINVDPGFVSATDFHLTSGSTPTSVSEGGLDLSASFTTDRDGVTRSAPWSMGAYESTW